MATGKIMFYKQWVFPFKGSLCPSKGHCLFHPASVSVPHRSRQTQARSTAALAGPGLRTTHELSVSGSGVYTQVLHPPQNRCHDPSHPLQPTLHPYGRDGLP